MKNHFTDALRRPFHLPETKNSISKSTNFFSTIKPSNKDQVGVKLIHTIWPEKETWESSRYRKINRAISSNIQAKTLTESSNDRKSKPTSPAIPSPPKIPNPSLYPSSPIKNSMYQQVLLNHHYLHHH